MKALSIIVSLWLIIQCNAIETPSYTVVNKLDDKIEIRKYVPAKWVCTSNQNSTTSMFSQLFNYISGQNDQNQKIPMTTPVINFYDELNQLKTKCFFISLAFQVNTPKPTGTVYVVDYQEVIVASIRFGGVATLNDYLLHKLELVQKLGDEISNFNALTFITAGYNHKQVENRINEVFLMKNY